jgi:hypothetical protein
MKHRKETSVAILVTCVSMSKKLILYLCSTFIKLGKKAIFYLYFQFINMSAANNTGHRNFDYTFIYILKRHFRLLLRGNGYDGATLTSQNCSLYGPFVHPRVICDVDYGCWYWLGLTPNLSTRALWQPSALSDGPVSTNISVAATFTWDTKIDYEAMTLLIPIRRYKPRRIWGYDIKMHIKLKQR